LGYLIDIAWHGFMSGDVEPSTFGDMARHLATVHLPLYLGCACVLVAAPRADSAAQSACGGDRVRGAAKRFPPSP